MGRGVVYTYSGPFPFSCAATLKFSDAPAPHAAPGVDHLAVLKWPAPQGKRDH